jgi:alginate O-acetyltransferase complex protein AlgI
MGFRFPENFNNPYTAKSITEFWRRWHMTLSNWLRDYVFLPVAYSASRKLKENRYLNVKTDQWLYMIATMVTMFVCGFWHGAAWTFILWGIYQGIMMVLERMFLVKLYKKTKNIIAVPLTFFLTILGWMIFRADTLRQALLYIRKLFDFIAVESTVHISPKYYTILVIAILFSFAALFKPVVRWQESLFTPDKSSLRHTLHTILAIVLFILSLSAITASGFNPFIYFRF